MQPVFTSSNQLSEDGAGDGWICLFKGQLWWRQQLNMLLNVSMGSQMTQTANNTNVDKVKDPNFVMVARQQEWRFMPQG